MNDPAASVDQKYRLVHWLYGDMCKRVVGLSVGSLSIKYRIVHSHQRRKVIWRRRLERRSSWSSSVVRRHLECCSLVFGVVWFYINVYCDSTIRCWFAVYHILQHGMAQCSLEVHTWYLFPPSRWQISGMLGMKGRK